jgi:hypothetical protein
MAQPYGPECISTLVKLLKHKTPQIRLAAARELLDRGYGKAAQAQPPRQMKHRSQSNLSNIQI